MSPTPPTSHVQDNFPFIVGSGRSGTTLLRALLDSHPDLAVPPESYFVVSLARQRGKYETDGGFATEAFLDDLTSHPRFEKWELPGVREALMETPPTDYADAIRRVFALYAERRGKPRYGDKTPRYVKDIPRLAGLFAESRFVHIIRDGRDVAMSFMDMEWGPERAIESAIRWRNWVEAGRRSGRKLGPERYQEVRYEELVADPAEALKPTCDFLGLDFDSAMLEYVERADEIAASNYYPEGHRRIFLPPTPGLRDWRSQLSREEVAKFELVAGDLLDQLGYERGATKAATDGGGRPPSRTDAGPPVPRAATVAGQVDEDVEVDRDIADLASEIARLRKRADHQSRRRSKALRKQARMKRRVTRRDQQIEKAERRRQRALRQRDKAEGHLEGIEQTRWWRLRLRFQRVVRPITAIRQRRRLR